MNREEIALHNAVWKNDVATVRRLVAEGISVNLNAGASGHSILHHAIDHGYAELAEVLIGAGADLYSTNTTGGTPLQAASYYGPLEVVKLIAEKIGDVDSRTPGRPDQSTALFRAIEGKKLDIVKYLISSGANINILLQYDSRTPLMRASELDNPKIVKILIAAGADVNAKNNRGETALLRAVSHEKIANVKILVDAGADLEVADTEYGHTPLIRAAYNGRPEIVKLLLARGANLNAIDRYKYKSIHNAISKRNIEVVRTLLEAGVDINEKFGSGFPTIDLCISSDRLDLLDLLIKSGADINRTYGYEKESLLHRAVDRRILGAVKMLIGNNASVDQKDSDGRTPLFYAVKKDEEEISRALIEAGADIFTVDSKGFTLLGMAAIRGNERILQMLMDRGVPVDARDGFERTALMLSANSVVFDILIAAGADINARDKYGSTPLFYAVTFNDCSLLEHMLGSGVDTKLTDNTGRTPLMLAAGEKFYKHIYNFDSSRSSLDIPETAFIYALKEIWDPLSSTAPDSVAIIERLIDGGVDISAVDDCGQTALHYATISDDVKAVELLLKAGADLKAKDRLGDDALRVAVGRNHCDVLSVLLDAGADPNSRYDGESIIHFAIGKMLKGSELSPEKKEQGNCIDLVDLLIDFGAEVDSRSKDNSTPLMLAAKYGNTDLAILLIEGGADVNAYNDSRLTPLMIAVSKGHYEMAKLFLNAGADVNAGGDVGRPMKGLLRLHKADQASINKETTAGREDIDRLKERLKNSLAEVKEADYRTIVRANTRFGQKLFEQVLKHNPDKNILISPPSIIFNLLAAYNGAAGSTRQEMADVLGLDSESPEFINRSSSFLFLELLNADRRIKLLIANSLWVMKGIAIKPEFRRICEDHFGATVTDLDLLSTEAVSMINEWVKEKTMGKIEKVIEGIDRDAFLLLINTVYFKGRWSKLFKRAETKEGRFFLANGKEKSHPMMTQTGNYKYQATPDFQAVALPYGAGRINLYIFLPNGDLSHFYHQFISKDLNHWMGGFSYNEGYIELPRFTLEQEWDLTKHLKSLGMDLIFNKREADFSNLCESDEEISIEWLRHKTFMRVNEEGTEAAAATASLYTVTSVKPPPFRMIIDRPFFFFIFDDKTEAILFMGMVSEPL